MLTGGDRDEQAHHVAEVEHRSSALTVGLLVAALVAIVAVVVLGRSGDDGPDVAADETTPPTTAARSPTTTVAAAVELPEGESDLVVRLPGADDLPTPFWAIGGPTPERSTTSLVRLDGDEIRLVTAKGRGELGAAVPVVRTDDRIVWSDGEHLMRIDAELELVPHVLRNAVDVHPLDEDRVWIRDGDEVRAVELSLGRVDSESGRTFYRLLAPLADGGFVVSVDGAAGVWWPGGLAARVATSYVDRSADRVVFADRDGLVLADVDPFVVVETLPIAFDGQPVGRGAISPDGTRVAVHLQRPGRTELVVVDLADGSVLPVGMFTDRREPMWVDDDRLLVLGAAEADRTIVWLVGADGTSRLNVPVAELLGARAWRLVPAP